jgi:hypothetical protein
MRREEPGDSQPIMSGEGHGWSWARWGWFELSQARVWTTYTHLQLKRRLRERDICLI